MLSECGGIVRVQSVTSVRLGCVIVVSASLLMPALVPWLTHFASSVKEEFGIMVSAYLYQ